MDTRKLENALSAWLRVDTWYTGHPKDKERFHRSLKVAFDEIGTGISSDDFRDAIMNVLAERHPGQEKSMSDVIEKYVELAEDIESYLFNVLTTGR